MVRRRSSSRSLRVRRFLSLRRLRLEGCGTESGPPTGRLGALPTQEEPDLWACAQRRSELRAHLVTSTSPDRSQGAQER